LSFTAMFHQYFQMGSRIRKHYLSPRVLFCLLTGRFVPPIHRKNLYSLQYSMLPAQRASLPDMWAALNSLPVKKRPAYKQSAGGGASGVGAKPMLLRHQVNGAAGTGRRANWGRRGGRGWSSQNAIT
jgi:phosphatidylinositol glycan class Q protein